MNKLFIAGCGIKFLSHMTTEVQAAITQCECVVFLVNDPAMKRWVIENSKKAISLDSIYFGATLREKAYALIVDEIIRVTIQNKTTCFLTYGHPLFLSDISSQVIENIERECPSIFIEVLPGISSLDTLICDLKIDLRSKGLETYEAMDFLKNNFGSNRNNHLILWQVGIVGIYDIIHSEENLTENSNKKNKLLKLQEKLITIYEENHSIILYIASIYPSMPFKKMNLPLFKLESVDVPRLTTAYVPPLFLNA